MDNGYIKHYSWDDDHGLPWGTNDSLDPPHTLPIAYASRAWCQSKYTPVETNMASWKIHHLQKEIHLSKLHVPVSYVLLPEWVQFWQHESHTNDPLFPSLWYQLKSFHQTSKTAPPEGMEFRGVAAMSCPPCRGDLDPVLPAPKISWSEKQPKITCLEKETISGYKLDHCPHIHPPSKVNRDVGTAPFCQKWWASFWMMIKPLSWKKGETRNSTYWKMVAVGIWGWNYLN